MEETASVLGQFLSGGRKLTRTETDRHTDKPAKLEAANLLLMSQLPPELTLANRTKEELNLISGTQEESGFSQFSGLYREDSA